MPVKLHHALSMHVDCRGVDVKQSDSSFGRELNERDLMIGEVHDDSSLVLAPEGHHH